MGERMSATVKLLAPLILAAGTLVPGVALAQAASAAEFTCYPAEKHLCSPGRGCQTGVVSVFARFSPTAPGRARYSRCDRRGCDQHEATTYQSGEHLIIELPGKATFAKVAPDGAWTEVVSIGNDIIIAQGRCAIER